MNDDMPPSFLRGDCRYQQQMAKEGARQRAMHWAEVFDLLQNYMGNRTDLFEDDYSQDSVETLQC